MTTYHDHRNWLNWIDELSEQNYVVIDNFLDRELYFHIRKFLSGHLERFSRAGIGADDRNLIQTGIRGDRTYWLDKVRDAELEGLWCLLQETKEVLNRYCFLSLSDQEFHLAHYPPGGHYTRHVDQFEGRDNRLISLVVYLNENWDEVKGGQLELEDASGSIQRIEPIARRAVLFNSREVPHAVLESYSDRYSLTGWFLYKPAVLGGLL